MVFEGDSRAVIKSFPEDVREDLGGDLRRVQNGERPLDSGSMAPALPGVFELRDQDKDLWYRVLYVRLEGVVYVLHCFTKKTNETLMRDINTARGRLNALKGRLAARKNKKKSAR
ncbi:MAG: type II toxin-antitoxin system RelE/ParE family toxin [Terriglobales bacterium]